MEQYSRCVSNSVRWIAVWVCLAGTLPASAQQPTVRGSFIITDDRDTVGIERFARTGDRLEGELLSRALPWQSYRLDGGSQPRTFELTIRPAYAPPGGTPNEIRRLVFGADSVSETITRRDSTTQRKRYAGRDAVPVLYPALALLEVATRRARLMRDSAVRIAFIEVGYQERQFLGPVTWIGSDSARVDLGGFEFRLAVDADGRVLGGSAPVLRVTVSRVDRWVELSPRDFAAKDGAPYSAEDVRIETPGNHWLTGTLTRPRSARGRLPVVVTIHGTGLLDRDGSPSEGFSGYQPFREIAESLAVRGVAVLRYDKRGVGGSSPGAGRTSEAIADDVRAILRFLRGRPDIDADRIALIGHSEGGVIAPMVAASDPDAVAAVALLAAPAWTGRAVIRWQGRMRLAANTALSEAQLDSAADQRIARTDAAAAPGSWMRFYLDYDPLPAARRLRVPVFILQGQTDQQVAPVQAEVLAKAMRESANDRVMVHLQPDMNHMLLDDANGSPANYVRLPSRKLNAQALRLLSDWLADQLRR